MPQNQSDDKCYTQMLATCRDVIKKFKNKDRTQGESPYKPLWEMRDRENRISVEASRIHRRMGEICLDEKTKIPQDPSTVGPFVGPDSELMNLRLGFIVEGISVKKAARKRLENKEKKMAQNPSDDGCEAQILATCRRIAEVLENPPHVLVDDPETIIDEGNHVYSAVLETWIALDSGAPVEHQTLQAHDFLNDALDIEYRVGSDKQYKSAEILIAYGGPNIWIDTKTNQVKGRWGDASCEVDYLDCIGLDDAAEELFNC